MASLSFPAIRSNLQAFAKTWKKATRENADAKLFWARFYECFGVSPEEATIYEKAVDKIDGSRGFIDSFIPGKLIVEHKSKGKDLDSAFTQASDYFLALPSGERPRFIIVSDFERFRLYDLKSDTQVECKLSDLHKHAGWFRFLLDDDAPEIVEESPINRHAAYAVSKLHEALLRANFSGRALEVFLTRLLFCFFADDILDARAKSPTSTLADLYDPLAMPPELRKAHAANDRAVDAAYGFKGDKSEAVRVAFLFALYNKLTSLLPSSKPKRAAKKAA